MTENLMVFASLLQKYKGSGSSNSLLPQATVVRKQVLKPRPNFCAVQWRVRVSGLLCVVPNVRLCHLPQETDDHESDTPVHTSDCSLPLWYIIGNTQVSGPANGNKHVLIQTVKRRCFALFRERKVTNLIVPCGDLLLTMFVPGDFAPFMPYSYARSAK
jgi:hypothetical protein